MSRYTRIPLSVEGGSLEWYLSEINDLSSPLSREEEEQLAERAQESRSH